MAPAARLVDAHQVMLAGESRASVKAHFETFKRAPALKLETPQVDPKSEPLEVEPLPVRLVPRPRTYLIPLIQLGSGVFVLRGSTCRALARAR